jgi:hypothetical protein
MILLSYTIYLKFWSYFETNTIFPGYWFEGYNMSFSDIKKTKKAIYMHSFEGSRHFGITSYDLRMRSPQSKDT